MNNYDRQLAVLLTAAAIAPVAGGMVYDTFLSKAIAGSTSKSITVTATVPANCNFAGGAVTLAFGSYDPTGANASSGSDLDQATTFDLRCTKGTSATIAINNGLNASGTTRQMSNSGVFLTYELYNDTSRTTIWNDTNTVTYNALSASPATFSIYGRVPKGQDAVSTGNYSDTVVVSATF